MTGGGWESPAHKGRQSSSRGSGLRADWHRALTEEAGRLLGWRRTDVEASAPFETSDFGELGHDLNVPVVVLVDFFAVVRGAVEDSVEAAEVVLQDAGQAGVHRALVVLKGRAVLLGEQPDFKREARGVGSQGNEILVFVYHAGAVLDLLPDHVAKNTAVLALA